MSARSWTVDQVRALGIRTDLVTACDVVYGCGRTKAYELHRTGQLDFPVLSAGNGFVVPVAPLLALLGIPQNADGAEPASSALAHHTEVVKGPRHDEYPTPRAV